MAFFEHILLNILENKRAKNFENCAKCAYKPIFSYSIKNSISPKMSLTTFLHSADEMKPVITKIACAWIDLVIRVYMLDDGSLRVRAFFHKTVRVCHVYCNLKLVSRVGLP